MKDTLKKAWRSIVGMNLAHALILGIVAKTLIFDISLAAVLLTVPVLAFEAYKLFLKSKTPDPIRMNEDVRKDLEQMKSKLSAMSMEKNVKSPTQRYF